MPEVRSLDFVLLETSIFGVNHGCTGRFINPAMAWLARIFNTCLTVTVTYLICSGKYFNANGNLAINFIARKMFLYVLSFTMLAIQIRYISQRYKIELFGQEFYRLYQLSTWNGSIYGCIIRIVYYLGFVLLFQLLPVYANNWKQGMGWRILTILFAWSNFFPTAIIEFIGQSMLLFQHEFKTLCQMTEDMVTEKSYGMEKLRALNRRHASLFALSNKVARFTGMDSLLIIESEILLILMCIFVQIHYNMIFPNHWSKQLLDYGLYSYRIERITHYCFRGHGVIMEANRFVSTLDKIDPLDFKNEELFTEFQIIRKQAKMRRLHFDCNRFLKVDIKLILYISKDLLTLILILIQLTTGSSIGTSQPSNATRVDNVTGYFFGFSDIAENGAK